VHLFAGVEGAVDGASGALRRPVPKGGHDVRLVDQGLVPLRRRLGIAPISFFCISPPSNTMSVGMERMS